MEYILNSYGTSVTLTVHEDVELYFDRFLNPVHNCAISFGHKVPKLDSSDVSGKLLLSNII